MPSLRPCPTCGKEVSSAAEGCPECGHAFGRKTSPGTWGCLLLIVISGIVVISTVVSIESNKPSTSPQPIEVAQTPTYTRVALTSLYKEYQANEVNAEAKFRNTFIEVEGVIASVEKSAGDEAVVTITDGEYLSRVRARAYLDGSQMAAAAAVKKGDSVILRCKGGGVRTSRPILKECFLGQE